MNYINDKTKEIKSYKALRKDNPSISLAPAGRDVLLEDWFLVKDKDRPKIDSDIEKVVQEKPAKIGKDYTKTWKVVPLTAEELNDKLVDLVSNKAAEFKKIRDQLVNGTTEVTVNGVTYPVDVDIANRSNMHQAYDNAGNSGIALTDKVDWKMGDNKYYLISYEEIAEIGSYIGEFVTSQFKHESLKLKEIESCNSDIKCIQQVRW